MVHGLYMNSSSAPSMQCGLSFPAGVSLRKASGGVLSCHCGSLQVLCGFWAALDFFGPWPFGLQATLRFGCLAFVDVVAGC